MHWSKLTRVKIVDCLKNHSLSDYKIRYSFRIFFLICSNIILCCDSPKSYPTHTHTQPHPHTCVHTQYMYFYTILCNFFLPQHNMTIVYVCCFLQEYAFVYVRR